MRYWKKCCFIVVAIALLCFALPQYISATMHGDFNNDGKIGSQDALYLLRHVLNPDEYAVDQSADVNGDGKVNSKDALHLLRHSLNPSGYPLVEAHDAISTPGKAASCTEDGLTEGSVCKVCNAVLQQQETIPSPGHHYVNGVCTACGEGDVSQGLQMELLDGSTGYAVTGIGQCNLTDIVIPGTYNGLPVTTVASQAFTGSGIHSVTLGKNITRIESCAFYQCEDLTEIFILAEDVVFGGSNIVHECPSLEAVHFAGDATYWAQAGFYLDESVLLTLNYGHNYSGRILVAADCTHQGITLYTCRDCGRTYQQQTEALGHYYSTADQVKPSCTESGSVDGECTRCGLHNKKTLPATGHSIESYTQQDAPSCESEGSEIGFCTECQQWFERAIPKIAHTPGDFVGSGEFCGDRELGSAACTVCGQTAYSVEHALDITTQLPTCTEGGSITTSCANCAYSTSTPLAAGGHTPGQWEVTQEATCTAEGVKVRKCVDCAAVTDSGVVPKRDHETVAEISDNNCTYSCRNCDYTETVSIENKWKVSFVTGCEPELAVLYVADGQTPELPTPVLDNYAFLAWYTDAEYSALYEGAPIVADTTLYAMWEARNITVSDNGYQGIIQGADTNYQFVVKSPFALTNSNVGNYITVTSSVGEIMEIFVAGSDGDRYYIGGNYAAGDIYEAVATGGILFEESGEDPLWIVVSGSQRENVVLKDEVVKYHKNQFFGQYSDDTYDYIFATEDLLDVGQLVVLTGDGENDLYAIYEVVGETAQGATFRYQCVIPDPKTVLSQVDLFDHITVDMSTVELQEGWEDAVIQSVRSSRSYAAFRSAASTYALQRSTNDSKYTYTLTDFDITTKRKKVWSSSTERTEMVITVEISCKLERRGKTGNTVVDISTISMTLENRFSMDADISADGILGGDARIVLTTHNTATADFVLKLGFMDNDESQEEYFRNLYKNALDKKDLLPIDTVPDGSETLVPAFYLPIPLGAGFALDIDAYVVLDWEVCGEFGVSVAFNNTMSFGFELRDWDFRAINYKHNTVSMHAYLAGKIRAAAGIRPEVGINWMKIVRAGANVTVSVYAECGGLVGFTVSNQQAITPQRAGYFECGLNLKAQLFGEIGFKKLNYRFDYTLVDEDYPFFTIGTKKMPLGFESDGEEYIIYMDYDSAVNLRDRVDLMLRTQSLGTMEIDRGLAEQCFFNLKDNISYVYLNSDGALKIYGCTLTEFDLNIRITSGTVYKDIIVHVFIDHTHEYTTTYHPGSCTKDERNFHECDNCTYEYWEVLTKAPGHDYSEYIVDQEPTCTQAGQRHGFCARCGWGSVEPIPALGHDYSLQIIDDAHLHSKATCQKPARYYYVCANCGGHNENRTYEYGDLGDHSYKDPYTCHDRACTTSGCTYISYAQTPHPFTDWIEVEPGGCCEDGYKIRACRDCGYTETTLGDNVIKQHDWQLQPAKAPTCDEVGYQDYIICIVCNAVANKTEVPKLSHNLLYKDITDTTHVAYCHRDGCDYESEPIAHTHEDWTLVYPAECEKEGLEQGFCICGHIQSKSIPALGHRFSSKVTQAPTCTTPGVMTYTCPCGDTYTEAMEALGHTNSSPKIENKNDATCTQDGSYDAVIYCITCSTELSREAKTLTKLGHNEGKPQLENEIPSTCQAVGSYDSVIYCTRCDEELSRQTYDKALIPCKPGETQIENETDSTCTVPGSYDAVTYCTMCGEELSRDTKDKPLADHTPGEEQIENATDSTCQKAGSYDVVVYCTICGEELSRDTQDKPLVDHTPGAEQIENETDSTCIVPGSYDTVTYCTMCGEELSRDTQDKPLVDHTPGEEQIENETDSTCQKPGSYDVVIYCSVCGEELSRKHNEKPLADHTPGEEQLENETDSTCQEAGSYDVVVYCTVCGEELSRKHNEKPLADHTSGEDKIDNVVLPECEKAGQHDVVKYCTVCGEETSRVTVADDPLGHDVLNAATGYDSEYHWKVCARENCNAILQKEQHNGTWTEDTPSTCSVKGTEIYICSCGYEDSRELALADHDHSGELLSNATEHYRICPVCEQEIDAESHDFTDQMIQTTEQHYRVCTICEMRTDLGYHIPVPNGETKQATCTENGYTPYKCPTCDYEWNGDIVMASGHDWSTELTYNDTFHYYPCRNCDAVQPGTMNGHSTTTRTTVYPTCTTPGYQYTDCIICDYSVGQAVDALGHDTLSGAVEYDDTHHWVICGRTGCGALLNKEAHRHIAGTPVAPDCVNSGYTVYRCACGHSYEADPVDALGHSGMDIWHESANGDQHYHACDRNGCNYETDRGTHDYGAWQTVIPETCSSYGTRERYCTVCNDVETDDQVPKLPHNLYENVRTETVSISGGVEYHHYVEEACHDCDYSRQIGETVVSSHGEITPLPKVWPTCTESGWETGWKCAVPGCTDASHSRPQVQIPALGHDYVDGYCTRCGVKNNDLQFTLNSEGDSYRVTGIGNCTDTDIRIPATYKGLPVTMIGTSAFAGNKNITSVYIPDTVDTIMWYAFYQCSNLNQVRIPNSVTSLGGYAFFGCTSLTSIDLPDHLTAIQEYTFYGCTKLGAIQIPANVTTIDRYAFQGCSSLTSVAIPSGVTQIGKGAFERCRGLIRMDIPLSVTSIGDSALYNCTALEYIYYEGTTAQWEAITKGSMWDTSCTYTLICLGDPAGSQGLAYTLNDDETYYIVSGIGTCTDTEIIIPETYQGLPVLIIGHSAFENNTTLTSVEIPEGVIAIGGRAFAGCTALTSVSIPESMVEIASEAFSGCKQLVTAQIPNSVLYFGDHVFYGCSGLTSVALGNGLTSIPAYTFAGCTSLTSVRIPNGVTEISMFAFDNCTKLVTVEIPNTVTTIGGYAFYNCNQLTNVVLPGSVRSIGDGAFTYCRSLTTMTLPNGITRIGYATFEGCTGLTEIIIPGSVTTIADNAFYYCTQLQTIYFDGTTAQWNAISKGTSWNDNCPAQVICLGDPAYSQGLAYTLSADETYYIVSGIGTCTDTKIVIPDTYQGLPVKEIRVQAFEYCANLTEITLPDSITRIGACAFGSCTSLTKITLPEGITSIADHTFLYCTNLAEITLPESLMHIGDYAFAKCTSLTEITIPESVTSIDECAFYYCTGLEKFNFNATAMEDCEIGDFIFIAAGQCSNGITVNIGANVTRIPAYLFWNAGYGYASSDAHKIVSVVFASNSVCHTIGEEAFAYCIDLTSVSLGNNLTNIGAGAFFRCSSLPDIILPDSLVTIGDSAFGYCSNLTSVVIPNSVTTLGNGTFAQCTKLVSISISDRVTSIGETTFIGCSALAEITLPSSITTIGDAAFADCTALETIYFLGTSSQWNAISKDTSWNENCPAQVVCLGDMVAMLDFEKSADGTYYSLTGVGDDFGDNELLYIPATYRDLPVTQVLTYRRMSCVKKIFLSANITELGDNAFYSCASLEEIHFAGTQEQWDAIVKGNNWCPAHEIQIICAS